MPTSRLESICLHMTYLIHVTVNYCEMSDGISRPSSLTGGCRKQALKSQKLNEEKKKKKS